MIDHNKKLPLVSILIFCYKNINLLFDMLDTVFQQDYPRIQLIVSDDGSQDFSIKHIQQYIEDHCKNNIEEFSVLKNSQNMGTVKHVHKVLQDAHGDYIVFTAADDRFFGEGVVSNYVEQFLAHPSSCWLVACTKIVSSDYTSTYYISPTEEDKPYFQEGNCHRLFSRWSRRSMAIPCSMAFQRKAFDLVGGIDLEYQYLEDWPLVLKLLRNGFAPIYLEKITAVHSTGGITNSNDRYGIEIRKAFYNDKYLVFSKEVEPYLDLLFLEDQKAYQQYLHEILERNYFFDIEYPNKSFVQKFKLCFAKPIRFWWIFEQQFMKRKQLFQRKKMFVFSNVFLLFSILFLSFTRIPSLQRLLQCMGILDLVIALFLFVITFVTYPLEKYFAYKAKFRTKLVN